MIGEPAANRVDPGDQERILDDDAVIIDLRIFRSALGYFLGRRESQRRQSQRLQEQRGKADEAELLHRHEYREPSLCKPENKVSIDSLGPEASLAPWGTIDMEADTDGD